MKGLLITTLAACLLAGTSVLAQTEEHQRGEHSPAPPAHGAAPPTHAAPGPGGGQPHPGAPPSGYAPRPGGGAQHPFQPQAGSQGGYAPRPGGGAQAPSHQQPGWQGAAGPRPGGQGAYDSHPSGQAGRGGPGNYHPQFGAPGARPGGPAPAYSSQYYPRQLHARDRFQWRGGAWQGPRGFYYRRWNYGDYLPFGWFTADWFIADYWGYNLPAPPYGYAWIRSGPDALLVDQRTGLVVETVYDVFY